MMLKIKNNTGKKYVFMLQNVSTSNKGEPQFKGHETWMGFI